VASHYRCNNDWSKADEALGQLISVVRGKFPETDKMRFGLTVANHGSTSEPVLGATGVHIEHHVIRWVRGVHAALYKEFLPDQPETNFCVSLPFPRLLSGQRARRLTVGLDQNHLTFVEELKKNRMAGRMDRIRCNNGKFTYECVWTKADQGEPCCIFGMNIYDWNRLGPAHLPQRSW
jgi:hypothetical protein